MLIGQELPLTIKQLVERSPFRIPGDDTVYTGKRETEIVAVDAKTGRILNQYGTSPASFMDASRCPPRDALDELDEEDNLFKNENVLMIGKTSKIIRTYC
jgi:serine/threonine-protein kinase/endoribonuclease IRE1